MLFSDKVFQFRTCDCGEQQRSWREFSGTGRNDLWADGGRRDPEAALEQPPEEAWVRVANLPHHLIDGAGGRAEKRVRPLEPRLGEVLPRALPVCLAKPPAQMPFTQADLPRQLLTVVFLVELLIQEQAGARDGIGDWRGVRQQPGQCRAEVLQKIGLPEVVAHVRSEGLDGKVLGAVAGDDEDVRPGQRPKPGDEVEAAFLPKDHVEDDGRNGCFRRIPNASAPVAASHTS